MRRPHAGVERVLLRKWLWLLLVRLSGITNLDPFRVTIRVFEQVFSRRFVKLLDCPRVPALIDRPKHSHLFPDHARVAESNLEGKERVEGEAVRECISQGQPTFQADKSSSAQRQVPLPRPLSWVGSRRLGQHLWVIARQQWDPTLAALRASLLGLGGYGSSRSKRWRRPSSRPKTCSSGWRRRRWSPRRKLRTRRSRRRLSATTLVRRSTAAVGHGGHGSKKRWCCWLADWRGTKVLSLHGLATSRCQRQGWGRLWLGTKQLSVPLLALL